MTSTMTVAGTPLLHITGQTAVRNIGRGRGSVHDAPDQLAMLAAVSKAAYRIERADQALGLIARAAAEALTPPAGPVSIELPIDIQKTRIERPAALDELAIPVIAPAEPDAAALDALADILAEAKRPLLWLGNGARHAGPGARRLMALGVGLITSIHGRAVVPEDHPLSLGALGATPEVVEFFRGVDLMIVAGSRLRGHETADGTLALPERRWRIDVDPAAANRGYSSQGLVSGDAGLALAGLAERIAGRLAVDPAFAGDLASVKAAARDRIRENLGVYGRLGEVVRAAAPSDVIWARDITLCNSTWGNRMFTLAAPDQNIYPIDTGIGQGIQLAIGASFAQAGRRVLAMCGDGGFPQCGRALDGGSGTLSRGLPGDERRRLRGDPQDSGCPIRRPPLLRRYVDPRPRRFRPGRRPAPLALPIRRAGRRRPRSGLRGSRPALVEVDMHALGPFPTAALPPHLRPKE
jgi:acetolactate synthase-1/2/3 large subunit